MFIYKIDFLNRIKKLIWVISGDIGGHSIGQPLSVSIWIGLQEPVYYKSKCEGTPSCWKSKRGFKCFCCVLAMLNLRQGIFRFTDDATIAQMLKCFRKRYDQSVVNYVADYYIDVCML